MKQQIYRIDDNAENQLFHLREISNISKYCAKRTLSSKKILPESLKAYSTIPIHPLLPS